MRLSILTPLIRIIPLILLLEACFAGAARATTAIHQDSEAEFKLWLPHIRADLFGAIRPDLPGKIAFVRDNDIYIYRPSTGEVRLLIRDGRNVAFTPNGAQLAFVRDDGLYLAAADGSNIRRVVAQTAIQKPRWTDDGSKLLWERSLDPAHFWYREIWTMALPAGTPAKIAIGADPAWAPDGLRVAYVTEPPEQSQRNQLRLVNWRGQNDWAVVTKLPANTPPIGIPGGEVPPEQLPYHLMSSPVWNAAGTAIYVPSYVLYQVLSSYYIWERADATNGGSVFVDELLAVEGIGEAVASPDRRGVIFRYGTARGDTLLTTRPIDPTLPPNTYAWAETAFDHESETSYLTPAWSPDSNAIVAIRCSLRCDLVLLAPGQQEPALLVPGVQSSDLSWGQ